MAPAVGALGYVPSAASRSSRLRRARATVLTVPDIVNAFWTMLAVTNLASNGPCLL